MSRALDLYARPANTARLGSVMDGPFAETKEHLGGFTIIEAESMDEALAISAQSAILKYGSIEVRPVLDQTHSETGQVRPELA